MGQNCGYGKRKHHKLNVKGVLGYRGTSPSPLLSLLPFLQRIFTQQMVLRGLPSDDKRQFCDELAIVVDQC
jgi:hypothetical protein